MKLEINEIIKGLKKLKESELKDLSDDAILLAAVQLYTGTNESIPPKRDFSNSKGKGYQKNTAWRNEPISDGQKKFLVEHGYEGKVDGLTKGEASDLIEKGKKRLEAMEKGEEYDTDY